MQHPNSQLEALVHDRQAELRRTRGSRRPRLQKLYARLGR